MHGIHFDDIVISESRQRREFKPEDNVKLADSISQNGLLHPVVVRREGDNYILVAGERRIRAMVYIWTFGQKVKCGDTEFDDHIVPCTLIGEVDPVDAFEMELEENVRRTDLTWQERSTATAQLMELRTQQAVRAGKPTPSAVDLAREILGNPDREALGSSGEKVRQELIVSQHLDDPDVAKAKTVGDAFKVLKRKEQTKRDQAYAAQIGPTFTSKVHTLLHGDCLEIMPTLPDESFDVILTDPPYGIDADQYGDSGGRTPGAHQYKDDLETWVYLMRGLAAESWRLAKPQSHLYIFCDVDNFVTLKRMLADAGWRVFRTPLIWINPTAMRTPWPEHGPQRKYQVVAYAVKGDRTVNNIAPDVLTYPSDENLGHEAQKPVAVYDDLLRRSIRPGNAVLDPFAGSGPIFPAAHALKCAATGIEKIQSAYGIAAGRINQLT